MGKYKMATQEFTVEQGLDTSDIEALRDEMQERRTVWIAKTHQSRSQ